MSLSSFANRIMLVIVLIVTCLQGMAQNTVPDGFYIATFSNHNCLHLLPQLAGKGNYCVLGEPIVQSRDVESLSKVQTVAKQKVMTLKFSSKGFKIWKDVLNNLPNALMLWVIEGYVVATFKNEGGHEFNGFPVTAPAESTELEWIYDHFKK